MKSVTNLDYSAEHMKTLEGLEGLRKSISMYLGGNDISTQNQGWKEVVDNILDEHDLLGITTPAKIIFCFKDGKYQAIFRDYGRGLPPSTLRNATGKAHTSSKFTVSSAYNGKTTGTHGLGLKLVVAASKNAIVMSSNKYEQGFIRYADMRVVDYLLKTTTEQHPSGTIVIAEYDPNVINEVGEYKDRGIAPFLEYLLFLCVFSPAMNIHVYLTDKWVSYDKLNKKAAELEEGIQAVIEEIDSLKVSKRIFDNDIPMTFEEYLKRQFDMNSPVVWQLNDFTNIGNDPRISYDAKFFLTKNLKVNKGGTIATVNMLQINDSQSHHVIGLQEEFKNILSKFIGDEDMKIWFLSSYKVPIYMILKVWYVNANFTDQTKKGFRDVNFLKPYKQMLMTQFASMPTDSFEELYDLLKDDIEKRFLEAFSKNYTSTKGLKNISLMLSNSDGYQPCISADKDLCELYIVEGRSAFSNAASACNPAFQAVVAQQGKPINGFKTPRDKFLNFPSIKDLMMIIGITPKDKDLSNINFKKIFSLADADEHGYHICTLNISNICKINPIIIEEGLVYLSNPPLYAVSMGEHVLFAKDYEALMESRAEVLFYPFFHFEAEYDHSGNKSPVNITALNGSNPYLALCYLITHIGVIISKAATSLDVDDHVLEVLLKCLKKEHGAYSLDYAMVKAYLNADRVIREGDHIIISMDAFDKHITWSSFIDECNKYLYYEFTRLNCHRIDLYVSTKKTNEMISVPMCMVEINKLFNRMVEKHGKFERFKGLGSMDTDQLKETCFDTTSRSFVQIKSIGDIDKIYAMLGVDSAQRKLMSRK